MNPALVDLLEESRDLGFLGPGPVRDHIFRAEAFATALPHSPARALDLGAGGGLPGLVLAALHWPDARWTFLDSQVRRTDFLARAVDQLDLGDRVLVVTDRAEVAARDQLHRGRYDLVTSRSFGRPAVTAECAVGFLEVGGWLVVSEPPEGDLDKRWPTDGVGLLGLGPAETITVVRGDQVEISATSSGFGSPAAALAATAADGHGSPDGAADAPLGSDHETTSDSAGADRHPEGKGSDAFVTHLVRMRQERATDDRHPRRVGLPAKRPLF